MKKIILFTILLTSSCLTFAQGLELMALTFSTSRISDGDNIILNETIEWSMELNVEVSITFKNRCLEIKNPQDHKFYELQLRDLNTIITEEGLKRSTGYIAYDSSGQQIPISIQKFTDKNKVLIIYTNESFWYRYTCIDLSKVDKE